MPEEKISRERCVELLKQKSAELRTLGQTRYPQRTDFADGEVVAIKAHLGPWPRALEAAGVKQPRENSRSPRERRVRRDR